jgi:hypothetical protein
MAASSRCGSEVADHAEVLIEVGGIAMRFITARVRPVKVYHGYDEQRQIIIDDLPTRDFVEMVIKVERILSFTDDYFFIECAHDTVQIWEYEGNLSGIKDQLQAAGMLLG